jgi:hypothetical protein
MSLPRKNNRMKNVTSINSISYLVMDQDQPYYLYYIPNANDYNKYLRAEVDGVSVNGLKDPVTYRTNSSHLFNVMMVDNNIYNLKGGTGRGFADDWFLFIKPLPVGEHKIHVAGAIDAPDPNCNSHGDVTWNIRVK